MADKFLTRNADDETITRRGTIGTALRDLREQTQGFALPGRPVTIETYNPPKCKRLDQYLREELHAEALLSPDWKPGQVVVDPPAVVGRVIRLRA
jgi:hypothetical protein